MAGNNAAEIKAKISLGGDKEYKSALKGINDELKLAKSYMAAATSAFDKNDSSAEALSARIEGLQGVFEAQQKKVALMREELEKLEGTEGASADDITRMKVALNNAEAAMNTTERQLETLRDATEDQADQTDDAADSTGDFKDRLKDAAEAAAGVTFDAVATSLAAVADAAASAIKELADMAGGVAEYADNINTLSSQTGVATDTLQKWTYAADLIDVPVETMTGAMTRLTKNVGNAAAGSDEAKDKFEKLGISIYDSSGNLKTSEDLFLEAVDALGAIENPTERDAAAMELFGKSAQELNPLIEAGTDKLQELGDEASNTGYVLSDDMMNAAQTYQDSLDRMNLAGDGLKNSLGAVVAPAFTELADTATTTMQNLTLAIQDGLDPGELETIMSGLIEEITVTLDNIMANITEFVPVAVDLLCGILTTLITKLPEYLPVLLEAATNLLTTIFESLGKIDWLELATNLINGLINGLSAAVDAAINLVTGIFQKIWDAVLDLFGIHSPSTVAADAGGYILAGLVEGFEKAVNAVVETVKKIFGKIWDAIKSIFGFGESEESKEAKQAGTDIMNGMSKGISGNEDKVKRQVKTTSEHIIAQFNKSFGNVNGTSSEGKKLSKVFIQGIADGMDANKGNSDKAAEKVVKSAFEAGKNWLTSGTGVFGGGASKAQEIGKAFADGFAKGISNNESTITKAARSAAQAAYQAAKAQLGIASPSKVMSEVGSWYDEGFAQGIEDSSKRVIDAVETLSDAAVEPAVSKVDKVAQSVAPVSAVGAESKGVTINTTYSGPFTRNDAMAFGSTLARSVRAVVGV